MYNLTTYIAHKKQAEEQFEALLNAQFLHTFRGFYLIFMELRKFAHINFFNFYKIYLVQRKLLIKALVNLEK